MRERFHRSSRGVFVALWALGALVLTGCGPAAPPPPKAGTQPPQEILKQRAQARWERLIARDFAGAYVFETPAYRATVDVRQYQSQFGTAAKWTGVTVDGVTIDPAGDRAEVQVTPQFETQAPLGGATIYGSQPLLEHWILTQGDWWLVHDD